MHLNAYLSLQEADGCEESEEVLFREALLRFVNEIARSLCFAMHQEDQSGHLQQLARSCSVPAGSHCRVKGQMGAGVQVQMSVQQ